MSGYGTISNLANSIEREISENDAAVGRHKREIESALSDAEAQGQSRLSASADARAESLFADIERIQAANRRLEARLVRAREVEAEERQQESRLGTTYRTTAGNGSQALSARPTATIRVGQEPHTYRSQVMRNPDGSAAEPTFINDLYRAQILNDPSAHERLGRHGSEMSVDNPERVQRAVATGGVPGFLPPAYLTELFAEYARGGRPTANLLRKVPLPPEGMTVNIPRVTSPTSTGVQATENATIANADPASTLLTSNVNTVGGYVVLSRQSVERGPLTEQVVVSDLSADYNAKLDAQVLNGSGSSGQHLGILNVASINAVTYTAATPVLVGAATPMWPKLASAIGQVMSGRFAGPNAIVMSPTEWVWMLAATDANNRPVVQPNQGAYQPAGLQEGVPTYQGVAGFLFNLPVILDGNMPANLGGGTNETRIVVADFEDLILFEDNNGAPAQLRFEQPSGNALGIMLVAYGYSALAAGRQPKAISVLSGTGLITPAL